MYSKLQNHRKKHCIASFVTGPGKNTGGCPSVPDNKENHFTNVLSGVPQGTVLAPLLFLLYVNDLPDCVCNKMKLYADDVLLYSDIYAFCSRWCSATRRFKSVIPLVCHIAYELQSSQVRILKNYK